MLRAEPIVAWRAWRVTHTSSVTFTREALERLGGVLPPLEELVGWRLLSASANFVWAAPPGAAGRRVVTAGCEYQGQMFPWLPNVEPHTLPAEPGCGCGFWGVADQADLAETTAHYLRSAGLSAVGRVQLWGRYTRHERGWRAQHARPLGLTVLWQKPAFVDVTSFGGRRQRLPAGPAGPGEADARVAAAALAAYYRVPTAVGELSRWLADRGVE